MFDWKSQAFPGYHPVHEPWNTKIAQVHWGLAEQQGLAAEYRINISGGTSLLFSDFTAYALDTGEVFDNVNMGATGLGYTVLTRGLVCFGKPKNGPSCFLAAPGFDIRNPDSFTRSPTILRGVTDPENDNRLDWQPVGGGAGLVALSFAGEAFFATYITGGYNGGARIEMSLDGFNWASSDVYPGDIGSFGGSVANNGSREKLGGYASAGYVVIDPDDFPDGGPTFSGDTYNLAWAAAPPRPVVVTPPDQEEGDPGTFTLDWHYNQAKGMSGQPGSRIDSGGYAPFSFASTIGGGKKKFVAAGTKKENLLRNFPDGQPRRIPNHTAAACVSDIGTKWTSVVLPGVTKADHTFSNDGDTDASSYGTCATFIRTKADDGYFLCGQYGYNWKTDGKGGFEYEDNTSVCKSDNGTTWDRVRNSSGAGRMFLTLSAIGRKMGEVVRL